MSAPIRLARLVRAGKLDKRAALKKMTLRQREMFFQELHRKRVPRVAAVLRERQQEGAR